jgi:hypothetical protein
LKFILLLLGIAMAPLAVGQKKGQTDPFLHPFANPADTPRIPRVLIIGGSIDVYGAWAELMTISWQHCSGDAIKSAEESVEFLASVMIKECKCFRFERNSKWVSVTPMIPSSMHVLESHERGGLHVEIFRSPSNYQNLHTRPFARRAFSLDVCSFLGGHAHLCSCEKTDGKSHPAKSFFRRPMHFEWSRNRELDDCRLRALKHEAVAINSICLPVNIMWRMLALEKNRASPIVACFRGVASGILGVGDVAMGVIDGYVDVNQVVFDLGL